MLDSEIKMINTTLEEIKNVLEALVSELQGLREDFTVRGQLE